MTPPDTAPPSAEGSRTVPSLDPRMNRLGLAPAADFAPADELDHWQTYEVFAQPARGAQHTHVGVVHAPNPDMALLLAKEQYTRRGRTVNLWVVRTAHITASDYADADMFEPGVDKSYREATAFRTRDVIAEYKARTGQAPLPAAPDEADDDGLGHFAPKPTQAPVGQGVPVAAPLPQSPAEAPQLAPAGEPVRTKPRIIIGKKKTS